MSPARDHRASAENWPTPHKARKVPWPRMAVITDAPPVRWVDRAACAGRWDEFDPSPAHETRAELTARVAAARRVCDRCPVRAACDEFAETTSPRVTGIYAGKYRSAATSKDRSKTP